MRGRVKTKFGSNKWQQETIDKRLGKGTGGMIAEYSKMLEKDKDRQKRIAMRGN